MENNPDLSTSAAMDWWCAMTFEDQFYKVIEWLSSQNRNTTDRHPHRLTKLEIQEIYQYNISKPKR